MAYYAIGDIHGCYKELIKMIKMINYDPGEDTVILIGDYIDRGPNSYDVISWIMNNKSQFLVPIRGNHEEEFIWYVDLLNKYSIGKDILSCYYELKHGNIEEAYKYDYSLEFDKYGTILQLIRDYSFGIAELNDWADLFKKMPLHYHKSFNKRYYNISHAGYSDSEVLDYEDLKSLKMYSRKISYGKDAIVIVGHTPTIEKTGYSYTGGNIYKYIDYKNNFQLYNIDCGCCFKNDIKDAKLACICLDTLKEYYL